MNKQRLVILISGRGSNMEALVRACAVEDWPAEVVGVVSNRPHAAGLAFARQHGIEALALDHKAHPTRESFDAELMQAVQALQPDWVLLAGFMRVLTPGFVQAFEGRLINIHPSLLPAFPGLHTHERALAMGCQFAGATVHGVTAELDHGPILAQAVVPILPGDGPDEVAARVLAQEHRMYPAVVRGLVTGRLRCDAQGRWVHEDPTEQHFIDTL